MLALDVDLQQSWCGEELLTLVTLMELQICEGERTRGRRLCHSWRGGPGRVRPSSHRASAELGTCAWRDLYSLLVKSTAVVQTVWMQKGV